MSAAIQQRTSRTRFWHRNYQLLLIGSASSAAGDSLTLLIFSYLAYTKTGSTSVYSIALICHFLPSIFGSVISGSVVDRSHPVRMIVCADLFRSATIFIVAISSMFFGMTSWLLFALAFLNGLAEAWFTPASKALLLNVVRKENLPKALAVFETTNQISELIFKGIGGFLLSTLRPLTLLVSNGCCFILSAFVESNIATKDLKSQNGSKEEKSALASDFSAGLGYVFSKPQLCRLLVFVGLINFFAIPGFVLLLPLVSAAGYGADFFGFGLSALATGNVLGSLLSSRITYYRRSARIAIGTLGFCVAWILIATIDSAMPLIFLLFIAGLFQSICRIVLQTTWLEKLDSRFIGRATSIQTMVISFLLPIGMLVTGSLGDVLPPATVLLWSYSLCGLLCTILLFQRRFRDSIDGDPKQQYAS